LTLGLCTPLATPICRGLPALPSHGPSHRSVAREASAASSGGNAAVRTLLQLLSRCIMTTQLHELLESNRLWAAKTEARTPGFFTALLKQQAPQYLWIGCADSRVPANELVDLLPGELFVHRNVGNVVVHSDLNCLSVMQFATDLLKVGHIIIVGHSGCGGVNAALNDRRIGLADNWIRHVQDVRNRHRVWLDTVPAQRRIDALCELNVVEQALNACQTTIVQDAWARDQKLVIHGWFYGLSNGLLQDLRMTVSGPAQMNETYDRAIAAVRSRYATSGGA
jgi:carbonic anhydrase